MDNWKWKKNGDKFNRPATQIEKYYRTYQDSPMFRITPATMLAGAYINYNLDEQLPTARKFLPLTNIHFVNNSAVGMLMFINGSPNGFLIPAGTNITFDRATLGGGVNFIRIQNNHASTTMTTGEVDIALWREGIVVDEAFKQMHKAFFKFLNFGRS